MNIIETINLTKYYGRSRGIIDVSLDIPEGEIFGFIGPNGAGKSTTIRTLLAFLRPTKGSAKIFDMDCILESPKIKNEIGYLPAEVGYYEDMKVKDLFNYSAKFYNKDCGKRIKELSEILKLDLNKKINSLSSGNKKKVSIVQTLLHEPKLLILDEPTSGLDPLIQNRFFEILKNENKKGVTIFFSSHILSEVQRICDRVAIIKEGRIIKIEQIDELRKNKYKKIKIAFADGVVVNNLTTDGIKNKLVKDNVLEFIYSGKIKNIIQELSGKDIDNIWIEEPALEEIFMHYYEGEDN
jgi:ABC-2 type transport system ATP-binding protein